MACINASLQCPRIIGVKRFAITQSIDDRVSMCVELNLSRRNL